MGLSLKPALPTGDEKRCRQYLDTAGEGIISIDCAGATTYVNPAAARLLGFSVDALVDTPLHDAVHSKRPDGTPYPAEECPCCRPPETFEAGAVNSEVFWRRTGEPISVEFTCSAIRENDLTVGAVICFRD